MQIRRKPELKNDAFDDNSVILDGPWFARKLSEAIDATELDILRMRISELRNTIDSSTDNQGKPDRPRGDRPDSSNGSQVSLRREILLSDLDQILASQTIERAKYYTRRLERGLKDVRTSSINDINLNRWKEYTDIITDSLWVLPRRDTAGAHLGWYWGNFVPQIPHQLIQRYTKKGDWVLDMFLGSGTTLIECRRLGRNGIGVELNAEVAHRAAELVEEQSNPSNVSTEVVVGDSRTVDLRERLLSRAVGSVQFLIMHPPYHDIINFSNEPTDLSNAVSSEQFLKMFGDVVDNASPLLDRGRYFALVIGDKYEEGEWVPLGFMCMSEVLKRGYSLKSIIVKNFDETRGKREQKQLWRYRALAGGFYIFKHEYILLFKKA
jgi:DNA methylase